MNAPEIVLIFELKERKKKNQHKSEYVLYNCCKKLVVPFILFICLKKKKKNIHTVLCSVIYLECI